MGPVMAQVTLQPVSCGSMLKSTRLCASKGLLKSSFMVTRCAGISSATSMRPAPDLSPFQL